MTQDPPPGRVPTHSDTYGPRAASDPHCSSVGSVRCFGSTAHCGCRAVVWPSRPRQQCCCCERHGQLKKRFLSLRGSMCLRKRMPGKSACPLQAMTRRTSATSEQDIITMCQSASRALTTAAVEAAVVREALSSMMRTNCSAAVHSAPSSA